MNRYYYDLHMHSCLSPCADNECTPGNLVGMGVLNGLNIMALTDHNTSRNCPAFFAAAKRYGIVPIAGMELTTTEDIHAVFLFRELEAALEFDKLVASRKPRIPNRTDIFGDQFIVNENDETVGTEEFFLSNATDITIEETLPLAREYGALCYPAHIDREANGILAVLGTLPPEPDFACVEINRPEKVEELTRLHHLESKHIIVSSDAHYLWDVKEKREYFELDDQPYSSALVRERIFELLERHK